LHCISFSKLGGCGWDSGRFVVVAAGKQNVGTGLTGLDDLDTKKRKEETK